MQNKAWDKALNWAEWEQHFKTQRGKWEVRREEWLTGWAANMCTKSAPWKQQVQLPGCLGLWKALGGRQHPEHSSTGQAQGWGWGKWQEIIYQYTELWSRAPAEVSTAPGVKTALDMERTRGVREDVESSCCCYSSVPWWGMWIKEEN